MVEDFITPFVSTRGFLYLANMSTLCNNLLSSAYHSCYNPNQSKDDYTVIMEGTDEVKKQMIYKNGKLYGEVVKIKGPKITVKRISDNEYINGWEQTIVFR